MPDENFTLHTRAEPRRFDVQRDEGGNPLGATALNAGQEGKGGSLAGLLSPDRVPELSKPIDQQILDKPIAEPEMASPEVGDKAVDDGQDADTDVQPEMVEAEQAKDDASQDEEGGASVTDYAEAIGVSPEVLYEMEVPVKQPDGTDAHLSVGAMKDRLAELERTAANAPTSETAADFTRQRAELDQMTEQRIAAIGQIEQEVIDQKLLINQANGWLEALQGDEGKELAAKDPGRLALAMQRATEQKQRAERVLQEHQQNQQGVAMHRMHQEVQATAQAMDGWMGPNGMVDTQRVRADMTEWLSVLGPEYGVTQQDLENTVSLRDVKMLRDLAKFHRMAKSATPEKAAQVRKPKIKQALSKVAAGGKSLGRTTAEKEAALRRKQARDLPEHHPDRWASINSVWDRHGGVPRRA